MKAEFLVQRDGKTFVLYAGLLDEAHQHGLTGIHTNLLQLPSEENGHTAIVQATVTTEKGTFQGIGDANANNVIRMMMPHVIRMAETRAKARALRDAINVGVVSLEELGESFAGGDGEPEHLQVGQPRREGAQPARNGASAGANASAQARATGQGIATATPAQVNALYAIGRRELHWAEEEVDAHCRSLYGKATAELSKREASELIERLKTNPASVR